MIKSNTLSISFLLFISFHCFSNNFGDVGRWSIPVALDLMSVPLINLPEAGMIAPKNDMFDLTGVDDYAAPPCETVGEICNDGNPNTNNDKIDADCECRGIAISCEYVEIGYEINSGIREVGAAEITVSEGDTVELFSNLENYTLTGPNGIVPDNTLNNIATADAGQYTVNGTYRITTPTARPILLSFSSQETVSEQAPASNVLDGNPATFWHSRYSGGTLANYPHEIQLDMGVNSVLSGFTYLPRQNSSNGRIGTYDIYVSNSTTEWGSPVVNNGIFANNATLKTVTFPATQGRYLRFVAKTPAISGQVWATAAEFGVLRTTATASSQEVAAPGNLALYAVDGNPNTFWHTQYTGGFAAAPHYITLDLGTDSNISGLEYLPRQSGGNNGTILNYEIYVSNSPTVWPSTPTATATWGVGPSLKTASFTETRGRYVRLQAISAQGDIPNVILASAAEVRAIRPTINMPCSKTITINVDPVETYTYNGAWSPSDPNGLTTPNDVLVIGSGDAVISDATICNTLLIEPGASLTVNAGATLTANTTTLNSSSQLYSSLIVNGEIIGVVEYKRWVNKKGTGVVSNGNNDLISSPVASATFNNAFVFVNPNLPENSENLGEYAFAPYNVVAGAYENFDIGDDRTGEFPLVSGTGYRAATLTGSTLTFTGTATKTNVDIAISDAPAGRAWNLIGNPYPSYLDFDTFFTLNKSKFQTGDAYQAIYGYDGLGGWTVWNQATILDDAVIELIAPGQGFFVKAVSGGNNTVSFTPTMRRTGSSDDFIQGRQENRNIALSKFKLSSTSSSVLASVYFIEGTSRGLDSGYDAHVFSGLAVDFSLFTAMPDNSSGADLAIQSLPFNDFNDVVVPLGIKAKAGVELTISLDELSTIPSNINVYLEDTENNTLTLLNTSTFKFRPKKSINGSDRFNVHYSSKTLTVEDMQSIDNLRIYTTASPKSLFIKGQLTRATIANLYDIQGRLVVRNVLSPNTTENTMDISTLSTGIYVVKVKNDTQVKTQKVIIK